MTSSGVGGCGGGTNVRAERWRAKKKERFGVESTSAHRSAQDIQAIPSSAVPALVIPAVSCCIDSPSRSRHMASVSPLRGARGTPCNTQRERNLAGRKGWWAALAPFVRCAKLRPSYPWNPNFGAGEFVAARASSMTRDSSGDSRREPHSSRVCARITMNSAAAGLPSARGIHCGRGRYWAGAANRAVSCCYNHPDPEKLIGYECGFNAFDEHG